MLYFLMRLLFFSDLYFKHLHTVKRILHKLSSNTKVLIWDDMLRGIKPSKWNELQRFNGIHPVSWNYQSSQSISHIDLMNYHEKFDNIWIATAFKGADGRTKSIPNFTARFYNHYSWLNFISYYKFGGEREVYNFKGIILTGWSRYSHMDPPCELLPVSMPSLISNLLLIRKYKTDKMSNYDNDGLDFTQLYKEFVDGEIKRRLKCVIDIDGELDFSSCLFESKDLYVLVKEYIIMARHIENIFNGEEFVISNIEYYEKCNYINMNNVDYYISLCNEYITKITIIERKLNKAMSRYYDKYFIEEYINSKTFSIKKKLNNVMKFFIIYLKNPTWKRRPVNNNNISLI